MHLSSIILPLLLGYLNKRFATKKRLHPNLIIVFLHKIRGWEKSDNVHEVFLILQNFFQAVYLFELLWVVCVDVHHWNLLDRVRRQRNLRLPMVYRRIILGLLIWAHSCFERLFKLSKTLKLYHAAVVFR